MVSCMTYVYIHYFFLLVIIIVLLDIIKRMAQMFGVMEKVLVCLFFIIDFQANLIKYNCFQTWSRAILNPSTISMSSITAFISWTRYDVIYFIWCEIHFDSSSGYYMTQTLTLIFEDYNYNISSAGQRTKRI